jgi:hypothetical protein
MDHQPFLTIVIPTKDRPDTLLSCLKSVLCSADPDIQVVVQDNACDPRTKAVVEQFTDRRLEYSRSPIRVSMRENFELGLKKARGQYLMFLGDDDAMTINAVSVLKQLVPLERPDFISWPATSYVWPSASQDKKGFIKLRRSKISGGYRRIDLAVTRNAIASADMEFTGTLGQVYCGCVSRALVERISSLQKGTYFTHVVPDFGSALTNLFEAEAGVFLKQPLSIAGRSAHSNGLASSGDKGARPEVATEYVLENKSDLAASGTLDATIPSMNYVTFKCLKSTEIQLGRAIGIDDLRWKRAVVSELVRKKRNAPDFVARLKADQDFTDFPDQIPVVDHKAIPKYKNKFNGVKLRSVHLRTKNADGEDDVYQAALLLDKLVGKQDALKPSGKVTGMLSWATILWRALRQE